MHPAVPPSADPEAPENGSLPALPKVRGHWRGAASVGAALVLHALLLLGIGAVLAERQGAFADGVFLVTLLGGESGGTSGSGSAPPAGARLSPPAAMETPPTPAVSPAAAPQPPPLSSAQIPAKPLLRKTAERPKLAPAPQEAPRVQAQSGEESLPPAPAGSGAAGTEQGGGSAGASAQGPPGGGYALGDVDRRPALLHGAKPEYPPLARRNRVQGSVTVRMLVSAQGVPGEITVIKSDPSGVFDSNVLRAVSAWRYSPAMKDGRAVPVWVTLPLHFSLQ